MTQSPFGWLGAISPAEKLKEACGSTPSAIDSHTLKAYAEQCGKEAALKWFAQETGVDVSGCTGKSAQQVPECISQNYGITFDIINKDGTVNWENVAHDAGAVGGIAVCAGMGLGIAAPVCGKIGAKLADLAVALVEGAYEIGEAVLEFFFGSEGPGTIVCNFKYASPSPIRAAKYAAQFMKTPKTVGNYPTDELIGTPVPGTVGQLAGWNQYWSRLFVLRGLAAASAAIADDLSRKSGAPFLSAVAALKPTAPKDWTELVRPSATVGPAAGGADYIMNIGGLLSIVLEPDAIWTYSKQMDKGQVIVPRWQHPSTWSTVSTKAVWYTLMFIETCKEQVTVWTEVKDEQAAKKKLSALPFSCPTGCNKAAPPGRSSGQSYWLFSVPASIDDLIRNSSEKTFKGLVALWRISLQADMNKKLAALKSSSSKPSGGLAETAVKTGIGAAALWTLFKVFVR